MSVLYKAMTEDMIRLIIEFDTAAEIWKTLKDLYTNESDFSKIHELHCMAFRMTQSGQPLPVFFTQLKNIWAEIDQRRPNKMKNADDIYCCLSREKELIRVHIFLNGFDAKDDSTKRELLRLATPPSLIQAFTYIKARPPSNALNPKVFVLRLPDHHLTSFHQRLFVPTSSSLVTPEV